MVTCSFHPTANLLATGYVGFERLGWGWCRGLELLLFYPVISCLAVSPRAKLVLLPGCLACAQPSRNFALRIPLQQTTHVRARTHTHTHADRQTDTHTRTHAYAHTYTSTQTHTHTHIHTHTCTDLKMRPHGYGTWALASAERCLSTARASQTTRSPALTGMYAF